MEETFRGRKRSSIIDIGSDAGKADFELVHKQKEGELQQKVAEFMADPKNHEPIVRPKTTPLPPLWKVCSFSFNVCWSVLANDKIVRPHDDCFSMLTGNHCKRKKYFSR